MCVCNGNGGRGVERFGVRRNGGERGATITAARWSRFNASAKAKSMEVEAAERAGADAVFDTILEMKNFASRVL